MMTKKILVGYDDGDSYGCGTGNAAFSGSGCGHGNVASSGYGSGDGNTVGYGSGTGHFGTSITGGCNSPNHSGTVEVN
jgi:hypothetical protein